MGTRLDKFKEVKANLQENLKDNAIVNHVKANKNVYIYVGSIVGAIGGTLVVSHYWHISSANPGTVTNTLTAGDNSVNQIAGRDVINTYNTTVERLSYITTNPATGEVWLTQKAAAEALGQSAKNVSKHINHGEPLPGTNTVLERIGIKGSQ